MISDEMDFLYDDVEETRTRFVSFIGKSKRFDLAILYTDRFFGKVMVIDIQSGRSALIGDDDLNEEGYLQHAFALNDEEAQLLHHFLFQVIQ
ncbi:DUF3055 domain-containing protein [Rubeoparvulum massiliense]|uniref:DUF3055 domain-containing protein n=1 Tax=Rubeoparvulum massiliense TaxID=1631346 RepID=UPI00065E8E28|nr:DUF3055 domain-containing protein [Rubeoparvulum massiliense]